MFSASVLESILAQLAQKPPMPPTSAAGWAMEVLRHLILERQKGGTDLSERMQRTLDALGSLLGGCLDAWRAGGTELAVSVDNLLVCLGNAEDPLLSKLGPGEVQMITTATTMLRTMLTNQAGETANAEAL